MNFSHLDASGAATMVDVADKAVSQRRAQARGRLRFPPEVYGALRASDGQTKKGAIFSTAQLAGIMGAKQTAQLIPLCHPLALEQIQLAFSYDDDHCAVEIHASCRVSGKTGVEMEALTAVSVAALTIYDMCKALSHDIIIEHIRLEEKSGGKSDFSRD